jgi:phosphonate transport system substrate-binding protein
VYYAGTHRKVTEDVLNGKAELGGCGCAEVDSARKNLNFSVKAAVIDSFSNIPLGPVVYNIKIGETFEKTILKSLLSLHKENNQVFKNFCNGWTEFKQALRFKKVKDSGYNAFRKMFGANQALWKLIE